MKYKNLFFDLDDTIWAFSRNARDTFEEVYQKYAFDRYFDSFDHYYMLYQKRNTELWIEYGEGKVTKDELNRQRFFYPLQAVINGLLDATAGGEGDVVLEQMRVATQIKFTSIIVATLPILVLYPMIEKHFGQGVLVGSFK